MPSLSSSISHQPTSSNRSHTTARKPLVFRIFLLGALLMAGFAAALSTAPAALAHDELVSSAPAAGERFETSPPELELVFSSALMDLGNQILVLDADGRNWAEAAPVLSRETLVQPLPTDMPGGEYSVRWRAVSSDGHPITGQFEFLVGAEAVAGSAATAVPAEDGAAEEPSAGATDSAESTASDDGGTTQWLPIFLAGVAGLAVYAVYAVMARRKRSRTE
ncbi:copper resistance CopC family protein [Arthrobacter sp. UYP6]|uniref:copper resistance CopC family protein n=1 Tax=Arthrobacter sp. UYP6 TaxID=1756378 RepID=UPI0033993AD0